MKDYEMEMLREKNERIKKRREAQSSNKPGRRVGERFAHGSAIHMQGATGPC